MLNVIDFPEREFCDRLHMTLPSQIVNRYLCGEVTGGAIPLNVASPVLPEAGNSGRFPPPLTAVAVTRAFESLREFWRGAAGLPAVLRQARENGFPAGVSPALTMEHRLFRKPFRLPSERALRCGQTIRTEDPCWRRRTPLLKSPL